MRELNISLDRAIDFFSNNNIKVEANPNSKLSEFEYLLLVNQFSASSSRSGNTNEVVLLQVALQIPLTLAKGTKPKKNEYVLNEKSQIIKLNISYNEISKLAPLKSLTSLEVLYGDNNNISDISEIANLKALKILDFSSNRISDIEQISSLVNLTDLNLSNNSIVSANSLAQLSNLKFLNLSVNKIKTINFVSDLKKLTKLYIGRNEIESVLFTHSLASLQNLELNKNKIKDATFLAFIPNLRSASLESNQIRNLQIANALHKLTFINLKDNQLDDLKGIENFPSVKSLELGINMISDLDEIAKLTALKDLRLANNQISDIRPLKSLLNKLIYLEIHDNPFAENQGWKVDSTTSQLNLVREFFSRVDNSQITYRMPVKVLLLGNHASGKSTLLDYLIGQNDGRLVPHKSSTHIIRIEYFPRERSGKQLPEIIYYDFGGQDYYHGIYKAFLTNNSLDIILWNTFNNKNQVREDSRNELTRDFTREYWMSQLTHYHGKHEIGKGENHPILLVQTMADSPDSEKSNLSNPDFKDYNFNEFYISLNQKFVENSKVSKASLDLLLANIDEGIDLRRQQLERPKWYGDFINFILNSTSKEATSLEKIRKEYNRPKLIVETESDILDYLKIELDQLHKQGLILYYKDELPNIAWLNPTETITHIHKDILQKKFTNSGGTIDKDILESNADKTIIKLLLQQHVIFYDNSSKKYIVPNFLRLVSDKDAEYKMITFGLSNPAFVFKSLNFLPFGIVNQLISHFGNNNDSKYFWRDQLIFTLEEKVKVLIKLDFDSLKISVYLQYIADDEEEKTQLLKYIFNCLLAVYWNEKLIRYEDFAKLSKIGRDIGDNISAGADELNQKIKLQTFETFFKTAEKFPNDFYISLDNVYFVNANELINRAYADEYTVPAYHFLQISYDEFETAKQGAKLYEPKISKNLPIYLFQNFIQLKTKKMKKIFISYSHANITEMKELKKYLVSFERNNQIEKWTDLELQAGVKVKEDILKNLEEADIVILLISQDFIASDFIYDNELQLAMKKKLKGNAEIVPVVLSDSAIFDLQLNVNADDDSPQQIKMGDYYFVPQDEYNNLKPINKWTQNDAAWMAVYQHIKKLVNT